MTSEPSDRERWDERYRSEEYVYGLEPVAFLRERIASLGTGRALDLAAGEGRNALFLAEHGFRVTAVDVSPVAIRKAEKLAAQRGIELETVVADLTTWDLGRERWDLITDFFFLERSLFPKIVAGLRPGGAFVMEHFSTDHPRIASYGPTRAELLLRPNELLGLLTGLRIVHYEDRRLEVREGKHEGPAAVVRVVARKEEP